MIRFTTLTCSSKESVSSGESLSLDVVSYCSQRAELPGEVARLISEVLGELSTLERDQITRWTYTASTLASSANSHSHCLFHPAKARGSTPEVILGDDTDQGVNWDDDEPRRGGPGGGPSGDASGRFHIQTAIGTPSPPSLGGPHRRCTCTLHHFMLILPLHSHLYPQRSGAGGRKQNSPRR